MKKRDAEWYRSIIDAMQDMVLVKGADSRLVWANRALLEYYGLTEEELEGLVDGPQSDPDDTLQYVRDDRTVIETGTSVFVAAETITDAGNNAHNFNTIKSPILEGSRVVGTVGVSRPVREIHSDDVGSHDEAKRFTVPLRAITDSFPTPMVLLDIGERVVNSSPLWDDAFGAPKRSAGVFFVKAYPSLAELHDLIDGALKGGEPVTRILTIERTGTSIMFQFALAPWRYPDGSIGGVTVTAADVTRLHRQEVALKASNSRYELMIEGANVGIWDWMDLGQDEQYWSPNFLALLGYQEGEIQGSYRTFAEILHPEDFERMDQTLQAHLAGKTSFRLRYRLRMKSGEYRWFLGSGQASQAVPGGPMRMVGSIQDVHEQVLGEEALRKSNEELEQFAYIASHDLREPLRGMRNFAQFLIEDYREAFDDDGRLYLDSIKKLGERLESFLDSLLYYSRLGRSEMAYQHVSLNTVVSEAIQTYLGPERADVQIDVQGNLPTVFCDPLKLSLIFGNLIINAIRYNLESEKRISIRHHVTDEGLHQFEVRDNGIGIKPAHWERVFTLFKRLHPREEFEGGAGMGLTLVRKAVERHGGSIWVADSEPTIGTTMAFTISEAVDGA